MRVSVTPIQKSEVLSLLNFRTFYETEIGATLPESNQRGWTRHNITCPLPGHQDNNPSFGVNTETGRYNCFSQCGGGDVFDFYCKMRGCDFRAALNDLAAWAGIVADGAGANAQTRSRESREDQRRRRQELMAREQAIQRFKAWEKDHAHRLGVCIFEAHHLIAQDPMKWGWLYHYLNSRQQDMDILLSDNLELKLEIFREATR